MHHSDITLFRSSPEIAFTNRDESRMHCGAAVEYSTVVNSLRLDLSSSLGKGRSPLANSDHTSDATAFAARMRSMLSLSKGHAPCVQACANAINQGKEAVQEPRIASVCSKPPPCSQASTVRMIAPRTKPVKAPVCTVVALGLTTNTVRAPACLI